MVDTKKRSFVKAATWRITGLIILSAISMLVTGSVETAAWIAVVYNIVQIWIYFWHERFWNVIPWGKTGGLFIQMTGLSGAGKTSCAKAVAKRLRAKGYSVEVIDGDEYRTNLCSDLGFSMEDRKENIRRLGFVGRKLAANNVIAIMSAINPYNDVRREISDRNTKLVWVCAKMETVRERDTKGLYARALLPSEHPEHVPNFTGISDPFETPSYTMAHYDGLTLYTSCETLDESVEKLENFILHNISRKT